MPLCGCHTKITQHRDRGQAYTDDLLTELSNVSRWTDLSRPLRQIALGGGTPNFLLPEDMRRLIAGIEAHTAIESDAERSIEVDPRAVTPDYIRMLVDLGFNRFSMGVQDLDESVMAAVNRPQALATVAEVVGAIRATADLPINMDLIYGLPRQTQDSWSRTLDQIIGQRPSRLAVYGYAHVPWMKKHQTALERHEVPDDSLRTMLNAMARERFLAAGCKPSVSTIMPCPPMSWRKRLGREPSTGTSWATPPGVGWIWWRWACLGCSSVGASFTPKTTSQSKPGERPFKPVNPVGIGGMVPVQRTFAVEKPFWKSRAICDWTSVKCPMAIVSPTTSRRSWSSWNPCGRMD